MVKKKVADMGEARGKFSQQSKKPGKIDEREKKAKLKT